MEQVTAFSYAVVDTAMITLIDYAPNVVRRWFLCNEYEGEALEERLKIRIGGGFSMFKAIYRMGLVNRHPLLCKGNTIKPESIKLAPLKNLTNSSQGTVDVLSLQRPGIPLVLNFGSCT
eukprot:m.37388 g.37388  ORF g.37388 m.37388 type:complete len:119 (-) comp17649_c0_seq3:449-805(-)